MIVFDPYPNVETIITTVAKMETTSIPKYGYVKAMRGGNSHNRAKLILYASRLLKKCFSKKIFQLLK